MFTVRKQAPSVDFDRCTACELCVSFCPHGCLGIVKERAALVRRAECRGEGLCVTICPERAIRMVSAPVRTLRKRYPRRGAVRQ